MGLLKNNSKKYSINWFKVKKKRKKKDRYLVLPEGGGIGCFAWALIQKLLS